MRGTRRGISVLLLALVWMMGLLPTAAAAAAPAVQLETGKGPHAIAIHAQSNKIYVANTASDTVTAIRGSNHTSTTIDVGETPYALAVNEGTNTIYVANADSNSVTVIDGVTGETASIAVGSRPMAIAVNPSTNTIYVANAGSDEVTIIDGGTHAVTTVAVGESPVAIAVNPAKNRIYVANMDSNTVSVINGATNAVIATLDVGSGPHVLAVHAATADVYVGNFFSADVTVINGKTHAASSIEVGNQPAAIAVHEGTGNIYVANARSNTISVINGATHAVTTAVTTGKGPGALAVDERNNLIYAANYESGTVTLINGGTHNTETVSTGKNPVAIAVHPATGQVYVANLNGANVATWSAAQPPLEPPETEGPSRQPDPDPPAAPEKEAVALLAAEELKEAIARLVEDGKGTVAHFEFGDEGTAYRIGIPAAAVAAAAELLPEATLALHAGNATYYLPVSLPELQAYFRQLGSGLGDATVFITLTRNSQPEQAKIAGKIEAMGGQLLVGPVSFGLSVDEHRIRPSKPFPYASLRLPAGLADNAAKGFLIDPLQGTMSFAPSRNQNHADGMIEVLFIGNGQGSFGVMAYAKSFGDMTQHWAKREVEALASRLVVQGVDAQRFAPDRPVLRAEFVALLVRALAVQADSDQKVVPFSDIKPGTWYEEVVAVAAKTGLVNGYEDRTFRPNDPITREQMATLITRALDWLSVEEKPALQQNDGLGRYTDRDTISQWASDAVARMTENGIMHGKGKSQFAPKAQATRAEAAVAIMRLLQQTGYIGQS